MRPKNINKEREDRKRSYLRERCTSHLLSSICKLNQEALELSSECVTLGRIHFRVTWIPFHYASPLHLGEISNRPCLLCCWVPENRSKKPKNKEEEEDLDERERDQERERENDSSVKRSCNIRLVFQWSNKSGKNITAWQVSVPDQTKKRCK